MLLPRRTHTWQAQPRCRSKAKAVNVRIDNSNPGSSRDNQSAGLSLWLRKLVSVLALLASVAALALIVNEQYGDVLARESPQWPAAVTSASTEGPRAVTTATPSAAEEDRYRALSEFVARRYRVSQDVAFDLVSLAHNVGRKLQLDPLLIIAVIAIESRFNPIAESVAGAKGLMQIIPKYHGDKLEEFGGEKAVFDPEINIQVGSQILKEYIRHTGHVGSALQMYAGALHDSEDQYTRKVMNEKQRLHQALPKAFKSRPPAATAPMRTAAAGASRSFAPQFD